MVFMAFLSFFGQGLKHDQMKKHMRLMGFLRKHGFRHVDRPKGGGCLCREVVSPIHLAAKRPGSKLREL